MEADLDNPDKTWNYSIYGLHVRSDYEIPNCIVEKKSGCADVTIGFRESVNRYLPVDTLTPVYESVGVADNGEPYFKVWKDKNNPQEYLGIQYTNGDGFTIFLINQTGSQIQIIRTKSILNADMFTYLLGSVMGCLLRVRKTTCLHAGVVAVGDKALAIIGAKGAGKSTTVAALAQQGLAVLSDDIAPLSEINGEFIVAPGYPRLRLWPNTVSAMSSLTSESLPKVLSSIEKRYLDLTIDDTAQQWQFCSKPVQLNAVYVLAGCNSTDKVSITPESQAAGMLNLVSNVYPEYSLHDSDSLRNFGVLGRLANCVSVRKVIRSDNLDTLFDLSSAILRDFKAL
jgi:hypothetical protein